MTSTPSPLYSGLAPSMNASSMASNLTDNLQATKALKEEATNSTECSAPSGAKRQPGSIVLERVAEIERTFRPLKRRTSLLERGRELSLNAGVADRDRQARLQHSAIDVGGHLTSRSGPTSRSETASSPWLDTPYICGEHLQFWVLHLWESGLCMSYTMSDRNAGCSH